MDLYRKKRFEILVEAPIVPRVTALLEAQGAQGYTVLPALSGLGADGPWSRDGLVGPAGQMLMILCIISEDKKDALLDALFPLVKRHIGSLAVSDCEVIRPERF